MSAMRKPSSSPGGIRAVSWRHLGGGICLEPPIPTVRGRTDSPRLIFLSDMGDAFIRMSDFEFLKSEAIEPIRSDKGRRHLWLWLTKRPERMPRHSNDSILCGRWTHGSVDSPSNPSGEESHPVN